MKNLYALYLHFLPVMVSMVILPGIVKAKKRNFLHERVAVTERHTNNERRAPSIIGATISEGTFKLGDELVVTLTMSEDVTVTGPVLVPLFFDFGGTIQAQYVPDGNPRVLTFKAYVTSGLYDATGVSLGGNYSGGSISGLSPVIPAYTSTQTIVDAIPPAAYSAKVTEGKLKVGDEVEITLYMSEAVTITGSPRIGLIFDIGNPLAATYVPDGNPWVLRFKATIPAEYYDTTGISVAGAVVGGTIQDLAGNQLASVFYDSPNSLVDGMPPYIVSVTLPADKVYHIGEDLIFTLNFSEAIVQYGAPMMSFQIYPGRLLQATYLDSPDTRKRRYKYTVTAGDDGRDGVSFTGIAVLSNGNGGYTDTFGNPLTDSWIRTVVHYPNGVIMDGIEPKITNIKLIPPGVRNDDKAYFQVTFNKPMAKIFRQVISSPGLGFVETVISTDRKFFQYNYTVTGNGTIRIDFPTWGTTIDSAGNAMTTPYTSDTFIIDQTAPTISGVDLPVDSTYKAGDLLTFTTHFSEPIVYSGGGGDIKLKLLIGSTVQTVSAISTTNSSATFQYTIGSNDNDADGITIQSLNLTAANTITDSATNNLVTTLSPAQVVNQIKIDNTKPSVTGYTTLPGHYSIGQVVSILAQFDEPVNVTGTPYLTTTIGAIAPTFTYAGGTGTNTLRFHYIVAAGREDSATLLLEQRMVLNGGTIKDRMGNDVNIPAQATTAFNNIYLDGVLPTVTAIQLTDPALTATGILHFVITTSEPVTSTDLSKLIAVNTDVTVNSIVATQTDATTFTVAVDVSGVADTVLPVTITVPGAVPFKDLAGNDISLPFTSNAYNIDGVLPVITGITLPPDKIYKMGQEMVFYVRTNRTVQLKDGLATLELNLDGGKVAMATCPGGSYILQFRHTVQYNELGMNGMQLGNAIKFDARFPLSRIIDAAGHSMPLTINNIPPSKILIDGVPPKITAWLPVTPKTYKIGDTIKMEGQVSEKIYITGTPELELLINGQKDTAQAITASAPDRLAYGYIVKEGPEGAAMANAFIPGSIIQDTAGNDLEFIPGPFLFAVYVDGGRPQITAINTPTLKGKLGEEIPIDVTFNEQIISTPTALLQVNMGGKTVNYAFKTLKDPYTATFTYQVQEGDADGTGVIVTHISGMTDNAGNECVFKKNDTTAMLIDGVRPVLDSVQLLSAKLTNNRQVSYMLHVSEPVNTNFTPAFVTTGDIQVGTVNLTATGNDIKVDVTTTGNNGSIQLVIDPAQIAFEDNYGNIAVQHLLMAETVRIHIATPVISSIVNPPNGIYRAGDVLTYTINTSEPLLIKNGLPSMTLVIDNQGTIDVPMSSASGNTLLFKYIVLDGQEDWDGVFYGYTLKTNNSNITDSAGNIFSPVIPYDPAALPHNTVHAKPAAIVDISTITPKMVTANDGILIYFQFDRAIKVSPEVTLKITIGNQTVDARLNTTIDNNPVTAQAIFQYDTKGTEYDMDGITIDSISLNGGTIKDDFNDAKINFAPKIFADVQVDAIAPTILSFTRLDPSPTNKDTIRFRVVFSKKMQRVPAYGFLAVKLPTVFFGSPIASKAVNDSTYDISVRVYGTGTIGLKPANRQYIDTHGNFVAQDTLVSELYTIDNYPPYVSDLTLPYAGTYKPGDKITIKASISEAVTITGGTPSIDLTLNTGGKVKAYLVKNDPTELTFQYTVKAGELDMDGIRIDSSLQLNGSKMIDAMGNSMYLPMDGVPATTNILVDGVAPYIVSIVRASATSVSKGLVTFMVTLSEANTTITNPANYHLVLTGDVQASISNIPAATASFPLTVNVMGGNGTIAWSIHNTVTDAAGNPIDLTTAYPNESFVVENIAAKVIAVGIPSNGTYKPGDKLTFTVTYNDTVYTKAGEPAPYISVAIGAKTVKAVRTGATGHDQYFEYTVVDNDLDVDGISIGTTIIGTLQNNWSGAADGTLRNVPATTGILVDGVAPKAILSTTSPARTNKDVLITAVFSEPVIDFSSSDIQLQGQGSVTGFSGSGDNYQFTLKPITDGTVTIDLPADGAADVAGNGMVASNKLVITFDLTAPVIIAPGNLSVAERSAAGTVISTMLATDASHIITGWKITSNTDQNANNIPDFAIDAASGVLTVNDPVLDYSGMKTVTIQVTTSDGLNTSAAQAITINITDVKSAPVDITLSHDEVPENNAVNAVVGQFSTTDEDLGDIFTYTLVSGAGDTDNTSFHISGNTLHINDVLDYEVKNSYSLRVRTTDSDGLTYEKAFTIRVTDVNEAPTVADISGETVCANADEHTKTVSGISAGPESTQVITPAIAVDQAFFSELAAVYNNDGTVTIRYQLKPGASGDAFVTLTIKDNGGTENGGIDKVSKSFILTVKAAPVLTITADPGATIPIGDIAVLTATGGSSYAWAAATGIVSGQNTAVLTVRPTTTTTYTLTAQSTESCTSTATMTINVRDDDKFEATNILTPNGDGINDRWVIKNIDMYPLNTVRIFNRAGRLVYTKTGYNNEWDGTTNGTVLPEDTYYYIVDLGVSGKINKGFITLLRSNK